MNVGLGAGLNKTEKIIVALLIENPDYNAGHLANEVKTTRRTIKRSTTSLLAKKL